MDKQPKIVEEVETPTPAQQSDQLKALVATMADSQDAINVANAAEPIELEIDGQTVAHLNIRLSPSETRRVMSMPIEARSIMATQILKERRLATDIRKEVERERAIVKYAAKQKRKARDKAKRRNR